MLTCTDYCSLARCPAAIFDSVRLSQAGNLSKMTALPGLSKGRHRVSLEASLAMGHDPAAALEPLASKPGAVAAGPLASLPLGAELA